MYRILRFCKQWLFLENNNRLTLYMYIIYANEITITVTLVHVYEYPDELPYQQNHCKLHYFFSLIIHIQTFLLLLFENRNGFRNTISKAFLCMQLLYRLCTCRKFDLNLLKASLFTNNMFSLRNQSKHILIIHQPSRRLNKSRR